MRYYERAILNIDSTSWVSVAEPVSSTSPPLTFIPRPVLLDPQSRTCRNKDKSSRCLASPSIMFLSNDASALIGLLFSIASFTSRALSRAQMETPSKAQKS
jgi:hypothetical protein